MGAIRLGAAEAPRHAVIGASVGHSVTHVGLLAESALLERSREVDASHMRPPLALSGTMTADVVAWLDDLSDDEALGISIWLDEIKTQESPHYTIIPAADRVDATTGGTIHRRFSCAGFVTSAYAEGAGVRLVVDEEELPEAGVELLERIWGPIARSRARSRYGLADAGPWRVLLPGYVIAALARGRSALPWRPSVDEADFPPAR